MKEKAREQFLKRSRKVVRRIKKKWKEYGEQDLLTRKEIGQRDKILLPLSKGFKKIGISANHITSAGLVIVTIQNIFMYFDHIFPALMLAVMAFFSDFIDGPRARLKNPETGQNEVTGLGTLLDHVRDYYEAFSLGIPAFFYAERYGWVDITAFNAILISYLLIAILVLYRYPTWPTLHSQNAEPLLLRHRIRYRIELILQFSKEKLQTDGSGRIQFASLAAGIILMFVGRVYTVPSLIHLSYLILGVTVGYGIQNFLNEYYEDEEDE
ncbi:MAG: CDP-alcohol phosphatidyltransferase family protein [bacterium]|nr:CDP-alcohol phosphatidyltransferase family protein [bacterium]